MRAQALEDAPADVVVTKEGIKRVRMLMPAHDARALDALYRTYLEHFVRHVLAAPAPHVALARVVERRPFADAFLGFYSRCLSRFDAEVIDSHVEESRARVEAVLSDAKGRTIATAVRRTFAVARRTNEHIEKRLASHPAASITPDAAAAAHIRYLDASFLLEHLQAVCVSALTGERANRKVLAALAREARAVADARAKLAKAWLDQVSPAQGSVDANDDDGVPARVTLTETGAAALAEILERPASPTPAMRRLMARVGRGG